MNSLKTYKELSSLNSFKERYEYLRLNRSVGVNTFGFERIFNQRFYRSKEWRRIRDIVFLRDNGCDLGIEGYDIHGQFIIHHMNPITIQDIEKASDLLFDPEYLITTTHLTHNAIHYGDDDLLPGPIIERKPFDTCPWKAEGGL